EVTVGEGERAALTAQLGRADEELALGDDLAHRSVAGRGEPSAEVRSARAAQRPPAPPPHATSQRTLAARCGLPCTAARSSAGATVAVPRFITTTPPA